MVEPLYEVMPHREASADKEISTTEFYPRCIQVLQIPPHCPEI